MITYADNWFDTIGSVIVFAVVLPFVDASVPWWIVAIPLVASVPRPSSTARGSRRSPSTLRRRDRPGPRQAANAFAAAGTIKSFAVEPAIVDDLHRRSETRERLAQRRRRQHVLLHSVLYGSTAAIAGACLVLAARVRAPAAAARAVAGTAVALIELIRRMPPMGSPMISIMPTRPAVAPKLRRMHALAPERRHRRHGRRPCGAADAAGSRRAPTPAFAALPPPLRRFDGGRCVRRHRRGRSLLLGRSACRSASASS